MKKRIKRMLMGHRNESGAVLILFTLSTVAIFGAMGLVHDFGRAYVENRQMQTAADAAALGGAFALKRGGDTDNIESNAQAELTRNGFAGGTSVINPQPQYGDFAGNPNFVEVILTKELQTYFGNFFEYGDLPNHDKVTIQTRAVAGLTGSGPGCIYVLAGDGEKAFHVTSGSELLAPDCDIIVSSCDDKGAFYVDGSTVEAHDVRVCGDFDDSGGTIIIDGDPDADPTTGVECGEPKCSRGNDPLEHLDPPSEADDPCDHSGETTVSGGTINPGVYCGGLKLDGNITLNPGIYVIKGGGLNITGDHTVNGEGVSFFLTTGSDDPKPLEFADATINLSARAGRW